MKARQGLKLGGFLVLVGLCLALLSAILTPVWTTWNDQNLVEGFYEQPGDTIEVGFYGASTTVCGISTIDMFQDWGLCSYSFGSGHQPLVSNLYWLKETNRLHGNSLKAAVFDPSAVFYSKTQTDEAEYAEKATAHMRFSPVKLEALQEYDQHYAAFDLMENLIPAIRYHSRWSSLTVDEFGSLFGAGLNTESHGQNVVFGVSAGNTSEEKLLTPKYDLTATQEKSSDQLLAKCQDYNLEILERTIQFCKDEGIALSFVVLPHMDWTDDKHDTIALIASEHGIPFADLNEPSLQEQIGLDTPFDYMDHNHANVSGARKLTRYIGEFLAQNGITGDSANNERYRFMNADVAAYNEEVEGIQFPLCQSFEDYLKLCNSERYVVCIASKDDAAAGLDSSSREALESLGLKKLAKAESIHSYVAVIDGGEVLVEKSSKSADDGTAAKCLFRDGTVTLPSKQADTDDVPNLLKVQSTAAKDGSKAIVKLNGDSISDNGKGLNFVVIDKKLNKVVDTCCFDTTKGSSRTTDQVPASYAQQLSKLKAAA